MEPILRPTLHKIPGGGMPIAKRENHTKDLTKLTRGELLEVKERQEHLLSNKFKLSRLPDKGKRIQDFYDKVQAELKRRKSVDNVVDLFSVLNIASKGQEALNKLEWNGRLSEKDLAANDAEEDVLDSDDESEMDPLRIIAQRQMHERRVKVLPAEPALITAADLAEIQTFETEATTDSGLSSGSTDYSNASSGDSNEAIANAEIVAIDVSAVLNKLKPSLKPVKTMLKDFKFENENSPTTAVDQHVLYVVEKTELTAAEQRERFKPYKTTISNVHDPQKERARKKGKLWENTAATPPLIEHNGAQLLTLLDSVDIQTNYLSKLKDLQTKQTADRLANKMERLELRKLQLPNTEELQNNSSFTALRSQSFIPPPLQIEGDPRFNEVDEVHDPLDEEKSGGVNYTVFD